MVECSLWSDTVKSLFGSSDLSEPMRRRVELAVAVAQERLLSTHVTHALKLIQIVGDQVPFENALHIYTRLLRLTEDEARVITTRALATLGERAPGPTIESEPPPEPEPEQEPEPWRPFSFVRIMRQRLRGRVNDELRRWVEMAAARTEVALLDTHVENALNFVELLENDKPPADAIELYLDALGVRESIAEVTYYVALSRLAEQELPDRGPVVTEETARPISTEERKLRVEG